MFRPIVLALLLVPGCAPDREAIQARPAMWAVRDADTEIVLLGTIHVLPDGVDWRRGAVAEAIDRADMLVLEVADIADAQRQAARFLAIGRASDLAPIVERVPQQRGELARIAGDTGPSLATLDGMKTWAAALALGGGLLRDVGAKRENGVDAVLARAFSAAGKPVAGLETADQQFALFDGLAEADQRTLLTITIAEAKDPQRKFGRLLAAWSNGDTDAIAARFNGHLRLATPLADALIDRRNATWAGWIARRMDMPGRVLVAVGAGHLAGEGSVQDRLAAKGLAVTRVQ